MGKKEPRKFVMVVKRKRKRIPPKCEVCLERIEAGKMKRGFTGKVKHEGRLLCVHHYKIETGQRVITAPRRKATLPSVRLGSVKDPKVRVEPTLKPVISKGYLAQMIAELKKS